MPQGAAGAPASFVSVMRLVKSNLDNIRMYLGDAIGSNDSPTTHVATLDTFLTRLRLHNLKLSPNKTRIIGVARVEFLGHIISQDGVRPNDDKIAALTCMPSLCQETLNNSEAYSVASAITANVCLTWPSEYAQLRLCSRKEPHLFLLPQWKRPLAPYSQNSQPHQ